MVELCSTEQMHLTATNNAHHLITQFRYVRCAPQNGTAYGHKSTQLHQHYVHYSAKFH